MTRDDATQVIADFEAARLKVCAGSGHGTAFDRLAKQHGLTPGQVMTRYYEARHVIDGDKVCSWCKGTGRS